jgi:hypothetical protein
MTPTLLGHWQVRIFLLATVGLVISLIVSLIVGNTLPLFVLLYVLLFGLVWDVIYQLITQFRWDRDWPTSFQVAAGVIEGALVWGLILTKKLPGIAVTPPFVVFLIQYGLIWLIIFVLVQGPLRIVFLKWRYQGGQWFVSRRAPASVPGYQQQPAPAFQFAGEYNAPPPPPQFAGGYNLQQPAPPPIVGGNYQGAINRAPIPPTVPAVGGTIAQQAVTPPPVVFTSNPDRGQGAINRPPTGERVGLQPVGTYTCVCGMTFDRGNFCPRCGRPKVQQGVS